MFPLNHSIVISFSVIFIMYVVCVPLIDEFKQIKRKNVKLVIQSINNSKKKVTLVSKNAK